MTIVLIFVSYAILLSVALARAGFRGQATRPGGTAHHEPARVLIVGATGGTGRELVAQALERGLAVTALVRDPSRLRVEHPRLTVVRGDVLDAASVDAAVRGQDAVLSALGHRRYFYPTRILSAGTRNIMRAMESHGVRRLVCETSLGLGDSAGRLGLMYTLFLIPAILPLYFWDKTRQERAIAESGLEWVIVRPGALNNGDRRGRVQEGRRVGSFLWTVRVSRADVAAFMLNQAASDTYIGAAPGVCWQDTVIIELKKGRDGPTILACVRPDGTRTWGRVARFFPVHDLTHCAVESVLGLKEAFFGLAASGWSIDDFAAPGVASRLPPEAVWAESIVGLLDLERGTGTEWTVAEFNAALAESLRGQGRAAFRLITADELTRTRRLRNDLQARWDELPPGEVLTVPFPVPAATHRE